MASTRALAALLCAALALLLTACGGDETTTVTETSAAGSEAAATDPGSGTALEEGEDAAAAEEIAPADPEAEAQIDEIAEGVEAAQQQAGAAAGGEIVGGEGDAPALSFQQAKGGLNQARYCGSRVVAGPNTSCSFALNVAYDFYSLGRARRFISYSPITGRAYRVYCRGRHPTVCVAGNNASIYIG